MGMLEDDLTEQSQMHNFSLYEYLYRQRRFSEKTFGPGSRAKGVIDHLSRSKRPPAISRNGSTW